MSNGAINQRRQRKENGKLSAGLVAAIVITWTLGPGQTSAMAQPTTANFIEWDLPSFVTAGPHDAGSCPAAIGALVRPPTGDPLYYVTRCESDSSTQPGRVGPNLVQFVPGSERGGTMAGTPARWTAWNLGLIVGSPAGGDLFPTGGMRLSSTNRAFVRGSTQLMRLNLGDGKLTHWNDVNPNPILPPSEPNSTSDVALVERYYGTVVDVWTTHNALLTGTPDDPLVPVATTPGIVQRLTVSNSSNNATITRWAVNGEAGDPYLSGVAQFQGKIYFVEAGPPTGDPYKHGNSIGVLDPVTSKVRRYSLTDVGAAGPLQLTIDSTGTVWVVTGGPPTGTGQLVSLKIRCDNKGEMTAYTIPGSSLGVPLTPGPASVPVSLSPNGGRVGFTEFGGDAVGLLIPNKPPMVVMPGLEEKVARVTTTLLGTCETVIPDTDLVTPLETQNASAFHTDMDPLGEFVETDLVQTGGFQPVGILSDWDHGTFWVTQNGGPNIHRLTRVSFQVACLTSAMVTGGGTIDPAPAAPEAVDPDLNAWAFDGGKANFGFNFYKKGTMGPVRGNFNYWNKVTGEHIKSLAIGSFTVSGNTATVSGTCDRDGLPCTFTLTLQDNGTPGKGRDTFSISGLGVVSNSGTLNGGNIMIHKWQ